jgi:hypothetical protein
MAIKSFCSIRGFDSYRYTSCCMAMREQVSLNVFGVFVTSTDTARALHIGAWQCVSSGVMSVKCQWFVSCQWFGVKLLIRKVLQMSF